VVEDGKLETEIFKILGGGMNRTHSWCEECDQKCKQDNSVEIVICPALPHKKILMLLRRGGDDERSMVWEGE